MAPLRGIGRWSVGALGNGAAVSAAAVYALPGSHSPGRHYAREPTPMTRSCAVATCLLAPLALATAAGAAAACPEHARPPAHECTAHESTAHESTASCSHDRVQAAMDRVAARAKDPGAAMLAMRMNLGMSAQCYPADLTDAELEALIAQYQLLPPTLTIEDGLRFFSAGT